MMQDEHKGIDDEDDDEPNAKDIEEEVKNDKIKAPRAVVVNKSQKESGEPLTMKRPL